MNEPEEKIDLTQYGERELSLVIFNNEKLLRACEQFFTIPENSDAAPLLKLLEIYRITAEQFAFFKRDMKAHCTELIAQKGG